MELITNILIEYLKHNKRLVVPKLGAFIVKQPSGIIRFSELIRTDDGILRSLLMAYGAKEIEACSMIDRFVFDVHHTISQGKNYIVEEFGEFSPGENNTITFKHKIEPKTFGGKIKPPVETFEIEKMRMLRAMGRDITNKPPMVANVEKPKTKRKKTKTEENSSIVKPEAYLRGLKYDKDKKRRNDERSDNRGSGKRNWILTILLLIVLTATIVWGVWFWRGGVSVDNKEVNNTLPIAVSDTLYREATDSIPHDTTKVDIFDDKVKDVSPSNSYLNPKFNKN